MLDIRNISSLLNSSVLISRTLSAYGFSWPDYLAMALTSFGILSNLVNIAVFFSSSLKDITYHYMLVKSVVNLAYLLFSLLNEFFIYCALCPQTFTYFASLYATAISFYLNGSLAIMRILIEIAISTRIFTILINRVWLNRVSYRVIISTIGIFSIVFYLEKPFCFEIVYLAKYNIYYLAYTSFGKSRLYTIMSLAQEMIRMMLTVVVLTIINVLNLVHFRRRFKSRRVRAGMRPSLPTQEPTNTNNQSLFRVNRLSVASSSIRKASFETGSTTFNSNGTSDGSRVSKNITQMVIFSSFIRIVGDLPLVAAVAVVSSSSQIEWANLLFYMAGILIFIPPAFDTFIYYFFNVNFRNVLNGYVKKFF